MSTEEFVKSVHPVDEELSGNGENGEPHLSNTPRMLQAQIQTQMQAPLDNTNKNFKGQQRNETVLCFTRKHWIVLLPHLIGLGIFIIAFSVFLIFAMRGDISAITNIASYRIIVGITLLLLTYWLHGFFNRLFNYYVQVIIVTNFRVIQLDQTLFFTRNRDSIDLPEIQDIVIQQKGLWKTIFNYGELTITLSSVHASKTLSCMPNPEYYFRKINKTKREYITLRRVEKKEGERNM